MFTKIYPFMPAVVKIKKKKAGTFCRPTWDSAGISYVNCRTFPLRNIILKKVHSKIIPKF